MGVPANKTKHYGVISEKLKAMGCRLSMKYAFELDGEKFHLDNDGIYHTESMNYSIYLTNRFILNYIDLANPKFDLIEIEKRLKPI